MPDFWNNTLAFSSKSEEWGTPPDFFCSLDAEFAFTLDVCASAENAKCPRYFDRQADGLSQPWDGICWMNPPYGKGIGAWIEKAYLESRRGCLVVALVPARTGTAWWHDWALKADEVRYVRGRLKFVGASKNGAPFDSAVLVFRPHKGA